MENPPVEDREKLIRETFVCVDRELDQLKSHYLLLKQSYNTYYIPLDYREQEDKQEYFPDKMYKEIISSKIGNYDWMYAYILHLDGVYHFIFLREGKVVVVKPYLKSRNEKVFEGRQFRNSFVNEKIRDLVILEKSKAGKEKEKLALFKEIQQLWYPEWNFDWQFEVKEKKLQGEMYQKLNKVMTLFEGYGKNQEHPPVGINVLRDMLCLYLADAILIFHINYSVYGHDSRIFGFSPPVYGDIDYEPARSTQIGMIHSIFMSLKRYVLSEDSEDQDRNMKKAVSACREFLDRHKKKQWPSHFLYDESDLNWKGKKEGE